MEESNFEFILNKFDKSMIYHELVDLNVELTNPDSDIDYNLCLIQLNKIIEKFNIPISKSRKKEEEDPSVTHIKSQQSNNLYRLLSRNLILVFHKTPTKVYDVANNLLNYLNNETSPIFELSIILLTDIFETFPNSLGSLMNFSINQIYKILKKDPEISGNLIYLLNSLTKYSTRPDIDEKLQGKLMKIINKNISTGINFDLTSTDSDNSTITLKKNYILVLRNLTVLSINANYEHLLASSAHSSSSGAKIKPESIMSHQHQFQTTLLTSIEKSIVSGLSNYNKDIRIAMVELLAHVFINFIPTGKFNPIEYLIGLFRIPNINKWNDTLTLKEDDVAIDVRDYTYNESEDILNGNVDEVLFNTGILETFIFYIQLESFQNSEYLTLNLSTILELILNKFNNLNLKNHIINSNWIKAIKQWSKVLEYLIKESGPNCHEILLNFLVDHFDSDNSNVEETKDKKLKGLFKTKPSNVSESININIYHNPYQCGLILTIIENLLPFGIDFNSFMKQGTKEDEDDEDDMKKLESPQQSVLVQLLLKLLINDNDYIRNFSLVTLLKYCKINEVEINQLVLTLFNLFNQELLNLSENKGNDTINLSINSSPLTPVKLLSYALSLSAIIKQTDSIILQNSTIVKILSFCTQNLKHNTSTSRINNLKNTSCWIILSSLVTFYNESEFVKLNSSQFLIFWKNLLNSQFVTSDLSGASNEGQEREIYDNLQLRNISLICLLNYINTVDLSPESLKQIQFLLVKSFNYLTYLESNMEIVSNVTNFDSFSEGNFNLNAVGNLLFSNYGYNKKLEFKDSIIHLILYSKKIIFKGFTKLVQYLKSDINSSMIILLIKIFCDGKLFTKDHLSKEKSKITKSTKRTNKIQDLDNNTIFLNQEFSYSYGVTSKFNDFSNNINELITIKGDSSVDNKVTNELFYIDPFYKQHDYKGMIEQNINDKVGNPWFDIFEELIYKNVEHSVLYDISILIQSDYSYLEKYPTNLITSLVDLSIELFQMVFPFLTLKIQSSLLEQLRSAISSKAISPLRYKAICINVSVALHGILNICHKKKISLDKDLVLTFMDILNKIDINNKNLLDVNCDSIGLSMSFITNKKVIHDQIDSYISSLINDTNPFKRGKSLLSMAKIYFYTGNGFNDMFNVCYQLLNDPNPIVYYYSLKANALLFNENNNSKNSSTSLIPQLITRMFNNFITNEFNYDIGGKILINLKYQYSSIGLKATILKNIVTTLGPNLRTLPVDIRQQLKSLIISLRYSIGSYQIDDQILIYQDLLRLLQELIIFDDKLINNEVNFYSNCLISIISNNLKLGLSTISSSSLNLDSIFPFNSNFGLYKLGFECFSELLKVYGNDILTKDIIELIWVSLNIKPCDELKFLVKLWMESNLEMNWFATLNSLFKISNKKLINPFIETNYQQKLLPLLQRQKKKKNNVIDFKDEEIENIVETNNDADDDKNEPISWEFKLFIYDLLNHLLTLSQKNTVLFEKLKLRISDLVKISFLGSTSPINIIKLRGISLLDKILKNFGDLEDSIYPGVSILEQQQAQIISAIIPCFKAQSNSQVIVNAVNVSSKFINLPRIKFYSKQRILKTLIYLLEELSSNKFLKFGFLDNISEFSKKSIQISILNCWALVTLNNNEDNEKEDELVSTLDKYKNLLISLWIISLKEFSVIKYNSDGTNAKELEIYNNYWINFISVLSLELEQNNQFVEQYLDNDASTFFFILFSQCVESLIKNNNVLEILISLNKLFKNDQLVNIIFNDEIFNELIDLFDRLLLIEEDNEIQCKLVVIINELFQTFIRSNEESELTRNFDKLFELVRLVMLPLFKFLPFLKNDYDSTDRQTQLLLKHIDSGPHLIVLKICFFNLIEMILKFPEIVRIDLYCCLMFIFIKIYEFGNELLVLIILPYLKQIFQEVKKVDEVKGKEMIVNFYRILKQFHCDFNDNSTILTIIILITIGDIQLNEQESISLGESIFSLLEKKDPMGIQCIKSLIQYSAKNNLYIVKFVVKNIVQSTLNDELDFTLSSEILLFFTKNETDESKLNQIYSLIIPLLLHGSKTFVNKQQVHGHLMDLIEYNSSVFKTVINQILTPEQKDLTEKLVKLSSNTYEAEDSQIELKTFS